MREGDFDGVEMEGLVFGIDFLCDVGLIEFHGDEVVEYIIDACFDHEVEGLDVVGSSHCQFK